MRAGVVTGMPRQVVASTRARDRCVVTPGTITDTGQLCGLSADFANWLLRSGSEDFSGYLHGTWDFENGLQAWANLAVYDAKGIWGTSPPAVVLPGNPALPAFHDAGSSPQDDLAASMASLEIDGLYIEFGLASIEGLEIDGQPATPDLLIARGPEPLCREIVEAVKAECGLSAEERKN